MNSRNILLLGAFLLIALCGHADARGHVLVSKEESLLADGYTAQVYKKFREAADWRVPYRGCEAEILRLFSIPPQEEQVSFIVLRSAEQAKLWRQKATGPSRVFQLVALAGLSLFIASVSLFIWRNFSREGGFIRQGAPLRILNIALSVVCWLLGLRLA